MTGEDRTTPRPWKATGTARALAISGRTYVYADPGSPDHALVLEAVNNYDRLRVIEDAARAYIGADAAYRGGPIHVIATLKSALRAALEGAPHDQ